MTVQKLQVAPVDFALLEAAHTPGLRADRALDRHTAMAVRQTADAFDLSFERLDAETWMLSREGTAASTIVNLPPGRSHDDMTLLRAAIELAIDPAAAFITNLAVVARAFSGRSKAFLRYGPRVAVDSDASDVVAELARVSFQMTDLLLADVADLVPPQIEWSALNLGVGFLLFVDARRDFPLILRGDIGSPEWIADQVGRMVVFRDWRHRARGFVAREAAARWLGAPDDNRTNLERALSRARSSQIGWIAEDFGVEIDQIEGGDTVRVKGPHRSRTVRWPLRESLAPEDLTQALITLTWDPALTDIENVSAFCEACKLEVAPVAGTLMYVSDAETGATRYVVGRLKLDLARAVHELLVERGRLLETLIPDDIEWVVSVHGPMLLAFVEPSSGVDCWWWGGSRTTAHEAAAVIIELAHRGPDDGPDDGDDPDDEPTGDPVPGRSLPVPA